MPFVVVDTNVSLPATLTPMGLTRKFWILLAFGAATYRAEHLQLELDALGRGGRDATATNQLAVRLGPGYRGRMVA